MKGIGHAIGKAKNSGKQKSGPLLARFYTPLFRFIMTLRFY